MKGYHQGDSAMDADLEARLDQAIYKMNLGLLADEPLLPLMTDALEAIRRSRKRHDRVIEDTLELARDIESAMESLIGQIENAS